MFELTKISFFKITKICIVLNPNSLQETQTRFTPHSVLNPIINFLYLHRRVFGTLLGCHISLWTLELCQEV